MWKYFLVFSLAFFGFLWLFFGFLWLFFGFSLAFLWLFFAHTAENIWNQKETKESNTCTEMTDDPYLHKHRICEYNEVTATLVSYVATDLSTDIPSWRSRLTCRLYTGGERDFTRAKCRKIEVEKESFARKGKWHIER